MKSPMLKRRLNPFLLATIILVLSILAALSVLYQGQLSNILDERNNLSETLDERNERISQLESENSNLSERISGLEDDVETYISENELLRSRIDSLNSTVDSQEEELEELEELEEDNSDLQQEVSGINSTLELFCGDVNNTIQAGETYCENYGHSYEGN
jgi:chromosome segregation ATPase